MIKISQAVVVEGKYDKIKLNSIIDAPIIATNGFRIFKDKEKLELLRSYAEKDGIIILTDSDNAGRQIRNYLKTAVKGKIYHIYIPELYGKERRKKTSSKQGFLGVEGMDIELLKTSFLRAGLIFEQEKTTLTEIKRQDLFDDGLIGGKLSKNKRKALLKELELPQNLSTTALLEALNSLFKLTDYKDALERID